MISSLSSPESGILLSTPLIVAPFSPPVSPSCLPLGKNVHAVLLN